MPKEEEITHKVQWDEQHEFELTSLGGENVTDVYYHDYEPHEDTYIKYYFKENKDPRRVLAEYIAARFMEEMMGHLEGEVNLEDEVKCEDEVKFEDEDEVNSALEMLTVTPKLCWSDTLGLMFGSLDLKYNNEKTLESENIEDDENKLKRDGMQESLIKVTLLRYMLQDGDANQFNVHLRADDKILTFDYGQAFYSAIKFVDKEYPKVLPDLFTDPKSLEELLVGMLFSPFNEDGNEHVELLSGGFIESKNAEKKQEIASMTLDVLYRLSGFDVDKIWDTIKNEIPRSFFLHCDSCLEKMEDGNTREESITSEDDADPIRLGVFLENIKTILTRRFSLIGSIGNHHLNLETFRNEYQRLFSTGNYDIKMSQRENLSLMAGQREDLSLLMAQSWSKALLSAQAEKTSPTLHSPTGIIEGSLSLSPQPTTTTDRVTMFAALKPDTTGLTSFTAFSFKPTGTQPTDTQPSETPSNGTGCN